VGDAFRRIAGLDVEDPPVVAAPHALGYRAKVSFTVRGSTIGFHRQGEPGRVFEVRRCLLLEPGLEVLHQRLRAARRFLPALTERVVIRRDADGGRHVVIHTTGGAPWQGAPSLAAALGEGVVVWWHPQDGAARAVAGSDDPWPVTVFEQVHPVMAARVRHEAVERLLEPVPGSGTPGLVWDLYAGIGETSALLAHRGVAVESVELDSRAVALAERRGPAGPRRLSGDVAECLQRLSPPWRVIVNPPRAGLAEPVSAALAAAAVERIVYVSCDPGTLARDLRRLAPSHHLAAVVAFDQFPQTAHVECLATLERR
jgi:23S rRNA (uracil1939-C5)-methyltransferase